MSLSDTQPIPILPGAPDIGFPRPNGAGARPSAEPAPVPADGPEWDDPWPGPSQGGQGAGGLGHDEPDLDEPDLDEPGQDGPWPAEPDHDEPGSAPPCVLDSTWAQTSQVTRLLCASAHLHGEYAEEAVGALLDPSFVAIAPSWGLDPVALAQHAKLASDRRKERDRSLRYLLAGMVLVPVVVVVLALASGLTPFSTALSIVTVSMGGFAAAWMIVFAHYELIRISSLEAMDARRAPRDTAPALDADTRRRLEHLAESNVVVFGGYQPFVGCGVTLDSWTVCIDLAPDAGRRLAPFDPLGLQDYLLRTVPAQTPGGLWAAPRLFVAGTAATGVPGLIPDPRERYTWPAGRLPQDVLDRFTREPSEAARTYACLAHPAWRGEIVVSMLVRAEVAGCKLFVEGRTHALLPPRATFREVKYVPKHPRRAWAAVARSAAAVVVPLLLGSYQRKFDLVKATHTFKRNRERLRKDLTEGHPFNYGATTSLREDVADPGELKYYAAVDEVRSFRVLKRQVLSAVETFLDDHGADTADFRRQADLSLGDTTVHLHDLAGAEDSFGPKNTITVGR